MSLLQNWRDIAYNQEADKKQLQQFWTNYFLIEKNIYEQLLSNPDEVVKGTVKELAEKYKVDVMTMVGFLDGINDRIDGLDAGADDYLVKPFALEELHARIRALLRRHNNQGESELNVGNLTLNMGRRQVWMSGEELILTPKEYALLSRLMLKAGSPVHREILYNDIYNWDNEPSTNTLEVHIHNLRDKVGKARIRTVRGFGYMLVANEEN